MADNGILSVLKRARSSERDHNADPVPWDLGQCVRDFRKSRGSRGRHVLRSRVGNIGATAHIKTRRWDTTSFRSVKTTQWFCGSQHWDV